MKFLQSTFHEYVQERKRFNLHPKMETIIKTLPDTIQDINNIIFYGSPGVGKYTQALGFVEKYSNNSLKYEKKIHIHFQNKQIYVLKISDIHFEVDFELLGCNARLLWYDIYTHILDVINAREKKEGIIICKNFHKIHSELLDTFYNFMQNSFDTNVIVKYFILTEHISFIPQNIQDICSVVSLPRPKYSAYKKLLQDTQHTTKQTIQEKEQQAQEQQAQEQQEKEQQDKETKTNDKNTHNIHTIYNIKDLKLNIHTFENDIDKVCNSILEIIENPETIDFYILRERLYDILIYQLDVYACMYYMVKHIVKKYGIHTKELCKMNIEIYKFLQYYNNNYRPIAHLERIVLYFCRVIMDACNKK